MAKKSAAVAEASDVVESSRAAKADPSRRIAITKTKDSEGILVGKLNEAALESAAAKLEIPDWDSTAPFEQRAVTMFVFQTEGEKAKKWECIVCTVCGGESSEDLDNCPYCGDGTEDAEQGDDEAEPEDPAPVAAKGKKDTATPSALAGAPKGDALAVVAKAPLVVKFKEKDLDKAIEVVNSRKGSAGAAYWDLGEAVAVIKDNDLWKLRPGNERPQQYRTFEQFCTAEIGMSPQSTLNAYDVFKKFQSPDGRKLAEKLGRAKMTFLVRADDDDRQTLLSAANSGASARQLGAKARQLKAGKPVVERGGKVRKPPAATKPVKQDTITVAALLEATTTLKLWKKPAKLAMLADTKSLVRAKNMGDVPAGRLELKNGAVMYLVFDKQESGELVARIKFAREDSVEEAKDAKK